MADMKIPDKQGNNSGIGYGKPPKGRRFAKGVSGNPAGRPKTRTFFEAIRAELQKRVEGGKGLKLDAAAVAFVDAMMGGSFQHAKEVIEREDGAVPEDVRVEVVWRKPGERDADSLD